MEMELDLDSPPSSPIIGYSAVDPVASFNSDEYCFKCKGPIRPSDPNFDPQSLLAGGELVAAIKMLNNKNNNATFDQNKQVGSGEEELDGFMQPMNKNLKFFNFPFFEPTKEQLRLFIQICRKSISQLENLVKPYPIHMGGETFSSDSGGGSVDLLEIDGGALNYNKAKPWTLRQDVCNFLNFVLRYSYLSRGNSISSNLCDNIPDLFLGLRKSLERIENWPAPMKSHGGFDDGNKMELRWFFLVLSGVNSQILEWVVEDLVQLAWFKFTTEKMSDWKPRMSHKVPFNCYCVKELWTMIKHVVDDVKPQGKDFWDFVTSILNRWDKQGSDLLFPLWLVVNLATLGSYSLKGQWMQSPTGIGETSTTNCYHFVRELIKAFLNSGDSTNSNSIPTSEIVLLLYKLLPHWGSDEGLTQLLWSYWSARIDKNCGVQDSNYWKSPEKWLSLVKSLSQNLADHENNEHVSSISADSDGFSWFIRLFCGHLRNYPKQKKIQKMTNMIYLKMPDSKLKNCNEMGLVRLSSLHLASIAAISESDDVMTVSKTFVNSFSNLCNTLTKAGNKHSSLRTVLTAEATMFLILLDKSQNISTHTPSFISQISGLMGSESKLQVDPKKRELIMVYWDLLDALSQKSSFLCNPNLGQETLLVTVLATWLKCASPDYLNRTLRVLHSLCLTVAKSAAHNPVGNSVSSWSNCPVITEIYKTCYPVIMGFAYRKKECFTDFEPLADLAADMTIYCYKSKANNNHLKFFDSFALSYLAVPELSQLYVEKLLEFPEQPVISDHLKLLQAWIRLICTGSVVPRSLTKQVLNDSSCEDDVGNNFFGFTNDSLLQLFCEQASLCDDWERKDVEDILKPLTELCSKVNWTPFKENLRCIEVTVNAANIILRKLKFTKIYSPKLPCVGTNILDFFSKLMNSIGGDDQLLTRLWYKYLPNVFEAITTVYPIWETDAYLKRQIQHLVTFAFTGFTATEFIQRNLDNHPSVKIMRLAIESDNVVILEEMLPNLKLGELSGGGRSSYLECLKALKAIFTRREASNLVAVVVYVLPAILTVLRCSTSALDALMPLSAELICSLLNPNLSHTVSLNPVVLTMKVKEAVQKELERHLSLNHRKYFRLMSNLLSHKCAYRAEVKRFVREELVPVFYEQIKLCELQRGSGHNDTLTSALRILEREIEYST